MTYQPLHHKYRPQTFADLVGQEAIAATLSHAIQQRRIAPAYLFTGARGTGKTSSARILAKSLNCLKHEQPTEQPCGTCDVCRAIANSAALDVIEIDAASNTGVDNIRELIERAQFAPVQCRYKVYIIDEVHMLSTAAFNALLKTLEEPPDRVVFVLATTDPQRVLATIISRCQRFDFRRIPLDAMVNHLRMIADKEAIAITDDASTLIAQISQGGLRDAESLLDQLSLLAEEVTVEKVWDLVGSVPERDLMALLEAIAQDDPESLLNSTRRLMDRGREPVIVLQNLASFYRDLLIAKTAPDRNDLVALTQSTWAKLCEFAQSIDTGMILAGQQHLRSSEVQIKNTTQPRLWLEITLMGLLPSAIAAQRTGTVGAGLSKEPAAQQTHLNTPLSPGIATANSRQTEAIAVSSVPSRQPNSTSVKQPAPSQADIPPSRSARPEEHELEADHASPEPRQDKERVAAIPGSPPVNSDLAQIWQQIIAHLHPLSKALLNEHGQLLAFNNQEAQIGISSEKLVKIAQNQVKNVEKAFAEVFGQTVRVSLEVAGPVSHRAASVQKPATPEPVPAPETQQTVESPKPAAVKNSYQPQASATVRPLSPSDAAPPKSPKPGIGKKGAKEATLQTNSWEEDDATQAAKQLAEFFAGKVVSDGEGMSEMQELDLEKLDDSPQKPPVLEEWDVSSGDTDDDTEDDDMNDDSDVPF